MILRFGYHYSTVLDYLDYFNNLFIYSGFKYHCLVVVFVCLTGHQQAENEQGDQLRLMMMKLMTKLLL